MNIGDDVTINGKIIETDVINGNPIVMLRVKSGLSIAVYESDINTVRPFKPRPEKDMRKGN